MHYRNGREAKNGDKIVKLQGGKVVAFGVLHSAVPGNDFCNGNIAVVQPANDYACMSRNFKDGGVPFCWHCSSQLVRIKGGFKFAIVVDRDGIEQ